jgi:putative membrane protein
VIAAILSSLHLLALTLGLPAVYVRGRALKSPLDGAGFKRLFAADNAWGIAAILFVTTGPLRAFAGFEKGPRFYLHSRLFWLKMALFVVILVLEAWPMLTFIRWRRALGRGQTPDTSRAPSLYMVTHVQMALVVIMVFVASFMARGFWVR